MPAARYWRAVGLQSVGGGALELSALRLYDAAGRADGTATLTSTIAPTAGTLAALQDEDLASTCRFAAAAVRASGFAIVWDLGAGNSADILGPRLAGPALATFLASCTLQCSDDGLLWQLVADFGRFDWPGAVAYTNAPAQGDPHFEKVALLLHFDGGLHDETGRVWTGNGAFSYVGGRFGFGFTSGGGWVSTPTSPDLNLSTGDFTIECFMDLTGTSGLRALLSSGVQNWGVGNIYILVDSVNRLEIGSFEAGHIWISSAALPSSGTFHFCLERLAGELRLLVGGVLVDSKLSGAALNFSTSGTRIGVNSETVNPFSGVIDELRITKGVARYTADFTPPDAPFPGAHGAGGPVFLPPLLRPSTGVPPIILSGGSAGAAGAVLLPSAIHLDRQDANGTETQTSTTRYRIPGPRWVKEKTASTNVPLRRRVQLYNQRDSRLVREVWSDPVTGEYSFDNIRGDTTYFVIAFDHTGHYRAVIADNLTPEPIP